MEKPLDRAMQAGGIVCKVRLSLLFDEMKTVRLSGFRPLHDLLT
jgi:hypothetical protein